MKNQYFGDRNDFLKYDLVLTLIEKIDLLNFFTFIPMLTQDDGSSDGGKTKYDGSRRKELDDFLKSCVKKSNRNIKNLRSFISSYKHIEYCPYRDDEYFSHARRKQYFDSVDTSALNESVILIDPDNGFEVKSMRSGIGHKYLKYSELSDLYARMGSNSLIMVYQHIPRVKREDYFAQIGQEVRKCMNVKGPMCLLDNWVAFFIMAKTDELANKIWKVINDYARENAYDVSKCGDDFDCSVSRVRPTLLRE